jgi:ribosomal protein L40E
MNGKVLCKKCGRTIGEFEKPCTENHDISPVMGKLMCRKCGESGLISVFQKSRCNSNHSIAVVGGVPQCRRCGAKKDWTKKRCGL